MSDSAAYGYEDSPRHSFYPTPYSVTHCGQCGCTEHDGNH